MDPAPHRLKISYCTTCKGRLEHLKETLPANLAMETGNADVEFVVLDYGDTDGLGEWIRQTFPDEIAQGRLRYARHETNNFKMAHAKNMVHRLATGDILCNVDADNFLAPGFSNWLRDIYARNSHAFITSFDVDPAQRVQRKVKRLLGKEVPMPDIGGTGGRMTISAEDFCRLGGYDESRYNAWGNDDLNLALRARGAGLEMLPLLDRYRGSAIEHGDEARYEHMSAADQRRSRINLEPNKTVLRRAENFVKLASRHGLRPDAAQAGCGEVVINFTAPHTIEPIPAERLAGTERKSTWQAKALGDKEQKMAINPA